MKKIKWVYKYKTIISTILIVALFVQPFVFLPQVGIKSNTNESIKIISLNTVSAQSSGTASSLYSGDGSNFSGISQWGNSQFINNPDIAKALQSCTNVVPSFQKKISGLFKRKKQIQSSKIDPDTAGSQAILGKKLAGSNLNACGDSNDKYVTGKSHGISALNLSLYSQDEINACDTSKNTTEKLDLNSDEAVKIKSDVLDNLAREAKATQENTLATKETVEGDKIRNECMDSIAFSMTKQALAGITESTVQWIEYGNWDDPYYLKEPARFFENLKKQTLKQTLGNLYDKSLDNLAQMGENADYPFLGTTYRNLLNRYASEDNFEQASKSTLGDFLVQVNSNYLSSVLVGNNANTTKSQAIDNWRNDFTQGGWGAWLEATQKPQNNKAGSAIMTDDYLSKKITTKETEIKQQLDNGNGFLSQTKCIEEEEVIPSKCIEYTDYQGQTIKAEDVNVDDLTTGAVTCSKTTPAQTIIRTRGITAKPNDPNCKKTEVVTPGSIIAERMKFVATTDVRQLELADQFNESLGAVFTAAFNRLQTEGLSSLSKDKYGSWEAQANRQSFLERYNSQFQKIGTSGQIDPAQLIVRRESTGYSSGDFDITTDLEDQQIGCVINPGVITTQKQYIAELEKTSRQKLPNGKIVDGPLLKILPAMAELDYCIPGPTTDWENSVNESFVGLYNTLVDNSIPFVRKDGTGVSTYYSSIGDKILQLKFETDRAQNNVVYANAASGLVSSALIICSTTCSTGYGAIVAAVVIVAAGVVKLVAINKEKKAAREEEQFSSAADDFENAALWAFDNESRIWTDEQLKNLVEDFNFYKQEVYDKFSNDNSIPIAAEARPFVGSIENYSINVRTLFAEYETEITEAKKDLAELEAINAEVKRIKSTAFARAQKMETDLEKTRNLPAGSLKGTLTDVPKECKPATNQCPKPADPITGQIKPSNLAAYLSTSAGQTHGITQQISFSSADMSSGSLGSVKIGKEIEVYEIIPEFQEGNGYQWTTVNFKTTPNTLSILANCSAGLADNQGREFLGGYINSPTVWTGRDVYGGIVFGRGEIVQTNEFCEVAAFGVDKKGNKIQSDIKKCTFVVTGATVSCKENSTSGGGSTSSSSLPSITKFEEINRPGSNITISRGQNITLEWSVSNSSYTTLTSNTSPGVLNKYPFRQSDSIILSPIQNTTYTLTAKNGVQQKTQQIMVIVN